MNSHPSTDSITVINYAWGAAAAVGPGCSSAVRRARHPTHCCCGTSHPAIVSRDDRAAMPAWTIEYADGSFERFYLVATVLQLTLTLRPIVSGSQT